MGRGFSEMQKQSLELLDQVQKEEKAEEIILNKFIERRKI